MNDELVFAGLPDGCPPDEAEPPHGEFFRLSRRNLAEGDVSAQEDWMLPHQNLKGDCAGDADRCECHAYSLFVDLDDLHAARRASPWFRKKSVAKIELVPAMGQILATPTELMNSHHDWWPTANVGVPAATVVEVAVE